MQKKSIPIPLVIINDVCHNYALFSASARGTIFGIVRAPELDRECGLCKLDRIDNRQTDRQADGGRLVGEGA